MTTNLETSSSTALETSEASATLAAQCLELPPFEAAYWQALPEIRQVQDTIHINIDVRSAVMMVLGRVAHLRALLRDAQELLPKLPTDIVDRLEVRARAAGHAYTLHVAATEPSVPLTEIADKATSVRAMLLSDCRALAHRGLIDGEPLEDLRGPVGYKNLAFDILLMDSLIRTDWAQVQGKTALTLEELDGAARLADHLLVAAGVKSAAPAEPLDTALVRDRAFTLFVKTYAEVRRAVMYLRWSEGDADEFAPSLYSGRAPRRVDDSPDPQPSLEPPPAAAGAATPSEAGVATRSEAAAADRSPFAP